MSFAKVLFSLSIVLLILSNEALGINVILKEEEIEYAVEKGEELYLISDETFVESATAWADVGIAESKFGFDFAISV